MILLDIIFVVKEKEHERYTREGNNLVYSFDVPLKEVLLNVRFLKN
jgi:DnaJ family protein B protein 4